MYMGNYNSNCTFIFMGLNFAFSLSGERSGSELRKSQLSIHLRSKRQVGHQELLRIEKRTDNIAV